MSDMPRQDLQLQAARSGYVLPEDASSLHRSAAFGVRSETLARGLDLALPAFGAWIVAEGYSAVMSTASNIAWAYAWLGLAAGFLFMCVNHLRGLYDPRAMGRLDWQLRQVAVNWIGVWLAIAFILFIFKSGAGLSRGITLSLVALGVPVLGLVRLMLFRRGARSVMSGVVRQGSQAGERVGALWLGDCPDFGKQLHRRFNVAVERGITLGRDGRFSEEQTREFVKSARAVGVERVFVALDERNILNLDHLVAILTSLRVPVSLHADSWDLQVYGAKAGAARSFTAAGSPIDRQPRLDVGMKRALDIAVAGLALPFLILPFAMIALAIKLDSKGPVIFRQRRLGLDSREFTILKFRSMRVLEDGAEVRQVTRGDDRVTRVGRFLRAHSLDELPQLFNVLSGEMSVVGPRPHAIAHDRSYEAVIKDYPLRRLVKPGLTGWAQIHGHRGETPSVEDMRQRVAHDLWYVRNWTVLQDISILLRTAGALLRNRDVY
jgi:Undecaprenyl-phosphate glucose phosphotransferase